MTEKTSLAYINDLAAQEISIERSAVTYENISGFEIAVNHDIDQAHEIHRASFTSSVNILKRRMELAGIEPLAIIPASWWNKIVDDTGMLNIYPNKDGTVYMDAKAVSKEVNDGLAPFGVFALWIAAWIAGVFSFGSQYLVTNVWTIILAAIVGLAVGTLSYATLHSTVFQPININMYLRRRGKKAVFEDMVTRDQYMHPVHVSFPTPPADVAAILSKARAASLDLRVASVQEAVSFSPSLDKLITREIKDERKRINEARRREILDALRDPIVFVQHESAVAIIAQFGEFPIEKAIVDQVMSSKI